MHVHGQGVVHRDFRADNLLIRSRDPWRVMVTDFGIAHQLRNPTAGQTRVEECAVNGPWRWVAPEAVRDETGKKSASFQTDVYMIGGLVFELLTCGQYPFYWIPDVHVGDHRLANPKVDFLQLAEAVGQDPRPWMLQDADSGCPSEAEELRLLEAIMKLCLRPDPSLRPPLDQLLAAVLGDEAQRARIVGEADLDSTYR